MSNATTVETQTKMSLGNDKQNRKKEATEMQETTKTLTNGNGNPYEEVMAGIIEPDFLPLTTASGALKDLMEHIETIPSNRVRKLGISVPQAVAAGRHYARCYAEDRAKFVQALNPCVFDPKSYDNLAKRSEALWEADVLLEKTEENNDDASKTADQARKVKHRFLRTAEYLWGDDAEKMEHVANAKSGYSHLDLANNIFTLYHLFIENWDEVTKRSDVTEDEIKHAHALGNQLLDAVGPSRDESVKAAQDLRDRAAEYLRQGIEDIRTAAGFIFRNDEKHLSRYPTLGSMRKRRRTDSQNGSEQVIEQSVLQIENKPGASDFLAQAI
ncbi:MAG: hypothetical protein GY847_33145 [Proteobacteria bacterium]|nr:hypothetical protein [Pseudomonadota bacterium]